MGCGSIRFKDLPDADADLAELIDCYVEKVKTDTWLRLLYSDVAALNFCKVIGHPVDKRISILGRMVNVLATIEMAQWLQSQIVNLSRLFIFGNKIGCRF